MKQTMRMLAVAAVLAMSGLAHAGGQSGSLGVGAEFQLNGFGGGSVNYDAGDFHVGGFLGFADPDGADNTLFGVGARFFFHVHSTAMSDFGVGGTFGVLSVPPTMVPGTERETHIYIEPGVQLRVFIAANVAVSASTGLAIGVVDAAGVAITGQTIGGGFHYYFF